MIIGNRFILSAALSHPFIVRGLTSLAFSFDIEEDPGVIPPSPKTSFPIDLDLGKG